MRVAVAQIEPKLGEKERNLDRLPRRGSRRPPRRARELLVLPECAIPGYVFESARRGAALRRGDPGPVDRRRSRRPARRLGVHVVCGLLERDGDAICATPPCSSGRTGSSARTARRTCRSSASTASSCAGDELPVFDTPTRPDRDRDLLRPALPGADARARARGRRHRRPADQLAGRGAGQRRAARAGARVREPHLPARREPGRKERTAEFCGRSQIVDPAGIRLAEADAASEVLLVADVDVELRARQVDRPRPGGVRDAPVRPPAARALRRSRRGDRHRHHLEGETPDGTRSRARPEGPTSRTTG